MQIKRSNCTTKSLIRTINDLIIIALDKLYAEDFYLIDNGHIYESEQDNKHHVGERSIVFRFAHYLQNLMDEDDRFQELHLDCEYNRNGASCKILPSFENGVFPDVIVHKRGSNSKNILVMEFKTYWNQNTVTDESKLAEFTDPHGEYKFQIGYLVVIERQRENVVLKRFRGGNLVPSI